MTCDHAHLDGAYVLGSLAAGERTKYERHLTECDDCSQAVREVAGLPGLLSRVPQEVLVEPVGAEAAPATLLPSVVSEVGEDRRRRMWHGWLAAAAVVLVLGLAGALAIALTGGDDEGAPTAAPPAGAEEMESLAGPWVSGWVALVEKDWGTQIELACTYGDGSTDDRIPYTVAIRTVAGDVEQLGSWRAESGREARVVLATSVPREEIAEVVVQTLDGRSVLRLEQ